jgi:hypothetical protein
MKYRGGTQILSVRAVADTSSAIRGIIAALSSSA